MSESPVTAGPGPSRAETAVGDQAARRRTIAVISHPDAGKSTLTEALALHARVIGRAGAVHGKSGRRGVVSDWMAMEKERGISITSAALQFSYQDVVVNLLDTPGHADFSEDTYRVLAAVDCAVMLIDAARGLEPQTLKLFEVCRHRGIPVITMINKWDRPGLDALTLCDELEQRIQLRPTPLTWPVGVAGGFAGLLDRRAGTMTRFGRTAGGATIAEEELLTAEQAEAAHALEWETALEESSLLDPLDVDGFLAGTSTPVLFGSAVLNIGVRQLLATVLELAPAPGPRPTVDGDPRPVTAPFSGLVFKVQAGMDTAHRDRMAFIRVCSGTFERGSVVTHSRTGKPFATKYAQSMMGRERSTVDLAYPGDVVGLVNATALTVGDTLYQEVPVTFPPMPTFAPEHFAVARAKDTSRGKQFRKGIEQLGEEGVVQVLVSELRGDASPIFAAVGPLQFEVATQRLATEYGTEISLDHLSFGLIRRIDDADAPLLSRERGVEVVHRPNGEPLALVSDRWRLQAIERNHPDVRLEPLLAGTD